MKVYLIHVTQGYLYKIYLLQIIVNIVPNYTENKPCLIPLYCKRKKKMKKCDTFNIICKISYTCIS